MKPLRLFIAAATLLVTPVDAMANAEVGQMAPDFTATDIQGEEFKLSDHQGKIVVLEWTNHQCPFVVKHYETGNMQKTQQTVKDMGDVEWVSIVSSAPGKQGHTTAEEAAQIVADHNAHPTAKILDESGEIGHLYGASATPHMFVIDENGVLAYAGAIDDNSSPSHDTVESAKNYVIAAVEDLKAGQDISTPTSQPYGCGVKY